MTELLIWIIPCAALAFLPSRALSQHREKPLAPSRVLLGMAVSFAGSLTAATAIYLFVRAVGQMGLPESPSPILGSWRVVLMVACLVLLPLVFADAVRFDWFKQPYRRAAGIELAAVTAAAAIGGLAALVLTSGHDVLTAVRVALVTLPIWVVWRLYAFLMRSVISEE